MDRTYPGQSIDADHSLDLINGTRWTLGEQTHDWRMLVIYRGLHCPICKKQLSELAPMLQDFADADVAVVAASMDSKDRAQKAFDDWDLGSLPIAYDISEDMAKSFGLYLSDSIKEDEPKRFIEPAILLFKGNTLHAVWQQSLPFARPKFDDILSGIQFINKEGYPARGTVSY
ncbi:MAG: redoxin domain-containing protein [Pseudomonadota bacterium]